MVIDMADRQVNNWCSNADREMHRSCVVREKQLTAREQTDELIECGSTAGIENWYRSSVGSIGRFSRLDGLRFGGHADHDKSHIRMTA